MTKGEQARRGAGGFGAQAIGAQATKVQAIGGLAIGAFAVGAVAIGALAIGRLVVIVRPSFLLGVRAHARAGEGLALRVGQLVRPLLIGPLRKYAPVDAFAVARTLARAAVTAPAGVTIIESDAIR